MKNIKIIFSISLIVIGMCLISSGILLIYKNEEKKSENQKISHINKENGSFHCTRETFEMQNYKIDYQYDFSFTDGKVNRASTLYIYTFKTKESYELFHINFSDIGLETEEDFDNKSLTKKIYNSCNFWRICRGCQSIFILYARNWICLWRKVIFIKPL